MQVFRRDVYGAELGSSDPNAKHPLITSIFFASLWFFYVTMSVSMVYKFASTLLSHSSLYCKHFAPMNRVG